MPIFRSTCPRHCYGSCGILSHINGNKLTRVLGDPDHGFTQGRLCPKGYALIQYALDRYRLKYPLRQIRRGSNEWRRISWEEASDLITAKILELNQRYGSNLALGYLKGAGNAGFLHQAVVGMFNSLGPHTRSVGDICSTSGANALQETVGSMPTPDPEQMKQAGLIVLWGANPAATNINQMKFIYDARRNGAPLVVIDPLFSQTAKRADIYIQIKPTTDAWLAWGVAKLLVAGGKIAEDFIQKKTIAFQDYQQSLNKIDLNEVCSRTAVSLEAVEELAHLYGEYKPVSTWLGFGLQRNYYGTQSVKAISTLNALTGNFGWPGAGIYYRHYHELDFPQALANHQGVVHPSIPCSREISVQNYPVEALNLTGPPLKMLWLSCSNPLAQGSNLQAWEALFDRLELIVTVDLYLTRTARRSDLILPAASFFEEEDLHLSFWHHWLSLNQKILPSFFEAKSDLQIARELTQELNLKRPGFSNFPANKEVRDWIDEEISERVKELYGLNSAADLYKKAYKRKSEELSPAWKYRFPKVQIEAFHQSTAAVQAKKSTKKGLLELTTPYRFLTPQSLLKFHTQYETLDWLNAEKEPVFEIGEDIAHCHNINSGQKVEVFNQNGFVVGKARINPALPANIILAEQSDLYPINTLIAHEDQGINLHPTSSSIPYYDCMVNIRRVRENV